MKRRHIRTIPILVLAAAFAVQPAFAEKPEHAGGKGRGNDRGQEHRPNAPRHDGRKADDHKPGRRHLEPQARRSGDVSVSIHFNTDQRRYVRDYYGGEFRRGSCPPGLAKKNNGCMPPGQARKWRRGYPLGPDVVYYSLDPVLVTRLGPPPHGYRYVRVASDILMIAIGTGIVADAIMDLGGY